MTRPPSLPRPLRWLLMAVLASLAGCAYVDQPEGAVPLDLRGQQAAWSGQWFDGEMTLTTRVEDAPAGILQVAWVEARGDELVLARHRLLMRHTDERLYANVEIPPGGRYLPLRITKAPRSFVLWGLLNADQDIDKPRLLTKHTPELYESGDYKVFTKLTDNMPAAQESSARPKPRPLPAP